MLDEEKDFDSFEEDQEFEPSDDSLVDFSNLDEEIFEDEDEEKDDDFDEDDEDFYDDEDDRD
ncbi:MAG: hypothetical protein JW787_16245 [Sedimentisphaerales bacterium]|nr:hypothetical protein [Sedimentisphaerales bacterium]